MPITRTILIVEPDENIARLLVGVGSTRGYRTSHVRDAASARPTIDEHALGVLITDETLPDGDGLALIAHAHRADPRTVILVLTQRGSIERAVRAVREGAYDYLTKPIDPAALGVALDRAVEARALRGEVEALRGRIASDDAFAQIVATSTAMRDVVHLVRRIADHPATVLITGPSGSGKERIAKALHQASRRRNEPFVPINVAAIPDALLESELFGHVRGAFTDARSDRTGMITEARGGTVFLDEIGDLPLGLQAKLLRVLQERELRPVGGSKSIPVEARFVAATHQDLRLALREGRFREDLFYRLAVIEVSVPPLRDRPEDILPLVEHFMHRAFTHAQRPMKGFSAAALKVLQAHPWPGNVRELENAVERAVALAQSAWISPEDLPPSLRAENTRDIFAEAAERMLTLEQLERGYVRHVLERLGGNKKRAATVLGINRRTIQRWLGEDEPEEPTDPQ